MKAGSQPKHPASQHILLLRITCRGFHFFPNSFVLLEGGNRPSPRERTSVRDRGEAGQTTHQRHEGGRKKLPPDFHLSPEGHFTVLTTTIGMGAGVVHRQTVVRAAVSVVAPFFIPVGVRREYADSWT